MSSVSITHTIFFFKTRSSEGGQHMVAQARMNVHQTMGRRNNYELNFFSMYFDRNNEETHYFKNSEK